MSDFVVSARRYRPVDFASVVGQGHITSTLKNAIARGQLAHAYLFCGPRGVGKTTCARIFAKAINCLSPVDNESCGECESCKAMSEGRSFNIHELDAASNNSVEDIRSLTEQVRIPPQVGRYSVYIIDEVHMLSAAAFNAFLKTLEEPPAHAIFILATTEKHKIIPTILSRCQIFDFNRIRVEDAVGYLRYIAQQQGVVADDESLHLIALKADGGMRDALSMFDKAVSFCGDNLQLREVARTLNVLDYDTYFNIAELLLKGDYQAALAAFDAVVRAGFSPQSFAAGLGGHFRDLLMSRNPQTLPLLEAGGTLLDRFRKQGAEAPEEFLFGAIAVLTAVDGTLRTASNQRLNVELSLMKITGLAQKKNSLSEGAAPLPELKSAKAQPAVGSTAPGKSGPQHAEALRSGRSVEDKPSGEPAAAPESKTDASAPLVAPESQAPASPAPESKTGAPVADNTETSGNAPTKSKTDASASAPAAAKKSILSGSSIGDIMNGAKSVREEEVPAADQPAQETLRVVDPRAEAKINAARGQFLSEIYAHRPRIAMALEEMVVRGNVVSVAVPGEQLREEILRNRTEILTSLAEVSGVVGRIDLEVEVRDDNTARKPIKAEDKLKFLTDRNPALTALRKGLNLELE
jgi:DNA polymerase-3 subunit gamma/tau